MSWTEPGHKGASDITGYDVRHIPSNSGSKASDSAWTLIEDAGTATTRSYTIVGLTDGRRRDVQVRAVNDDGDGDWSVTARGTPSTTNSEPFFVEGTTAARSVREDSTAGQSIGSPVGARDYESDTFTYTLGGRDASLLDIGSSTGQLQVNEPLDYESKSSHTVTVSVSDSKDNDGEADTATDATIAVTVTVENVNEEPELTGDTEIDYAENRDLPVIEYTATDPEGSTVMWDLSGTDQGAFEQSDGELEFLNPPDYENPTDQRGGTDQAGDNVYSIVVIVSDGAQSNPVPVTITVTNVNEPFKLEGATAFDYDENDTGSVGTFTVLDDPENGPIDWVLSGTDRGDFTLDNGELSFVAVPDHEKPADSNRDNRYHATVTADDRDNQESLSVIVTVIDLDEPGEVTLDLLQPQVGTGLRATLVDPDRGHTGLAWSWDSSPSGFGGWTPITGADSRSYTPMATDVGRYLRATVSYSDTHGTV